MGVDAYHSRLIPLWNAMRMHGFAKRSKIGGGKSHEPWFSVWIKIFAGMIGKGEEMRWFCLYGCKFGPMIRGITLNSHAPLTHQTPHIGPEAGNLGIRPSGGSDPESAGCDRLGDGV